MFISAHYGGNDLVLKFEEGEQWKKVFGPVFMYLNSSSTEEEDPLTLWKDAKNQVSTKPFHVSTFLYSEVHHLGS